MTGEMKNKRTTGERNEENVQSLADVRGERRGSSAECSTDACEDATEGRRSSVSGGRCGSEGAATEGLDECLGGGSGGPPDFRRGPAKSVTAPRLRPRAVGSRTIIARSTPDLDGDSSPPIRPGYPSPCFLLLGTASASANGLPLTAPGGTNDELPVAAKADALLASRSNAHSRKPSPRSMLAASVSLSIPIPVPLSRWCPTEEYPEVDPISQL